MRFIAGSMARLMVLDCMEVAALRWAATRGARSGRVAA